MEHLIRIDRFYYTKNTTIGRLYINNEYFGYTLEDTVRPYGIKVDEHTAIPLNNKKTLFKVGVTYSNRFGKEMPLIYNVDTYNLKAGGIKFGGVRFHGGNNHTNTEGCVLVAEYWNKDDLISSSLSDKLTIRVKELQNTCEVYLLIRNFKQMG